MRTRIIAASLFFFSLSGLAAERIALVIGNSDYQNLPSLTNPHYDALKIAERLEELGFAVTLAENLDAYSLRAAVANFSNQITPQTEVSFLFYAGHGVEISGKSYLLPVDLRFQQNSGLNLNQQYAIGGIEARGLIDEIAQAGGKTNIMIFDACRNLPARGLNSFHIATRPYSNMLIAYSTQAGQAAADGVAGENSPYTRALLKYLGKPNWSILQTFNATNSEINSQTQMAEMHLTSIKDIVLQPTSASAIEPPTSPATNPPATVESSSDWFENLVRWADKFHLPAEDFPREKDALLALQELFLEADIPYLPAEIGHLTALEQLDVSGNQLTDLPAEMAQLKHLKRLNIRGNQFSTFPPVLAKLPQLEILIVAENQLTDLPEAVSQLKHLRALIIGNNRFSFIPEPIFALKSLQELSLSSNHIESIPNEIGQLKHLKSLNLSGNKILSLPASIGNLTQLEVLSLLNNKIRALPPEIGRLHRLRMLMLQMNQLSDLPSEIEYLQYLTLFDVSENQLQFLPAGIGQLTHLEEFYLGLNPLQSLPETIGQWQNLNTLSLHKTKLRSLPNSLTQLRQLEIFDIRGATQLTLTPNQRKFLQGIKSFMHD